MIELYRLVILTMETVRIIIALSNESNLTNMRSLLTENGFSVVDVLKDGQDCIRKARMLNPDVAILDFDLAIFTGYEAARVLCEDRVCSAILIANEGQKSLLNEHWDSEDFICLVKPINRSALISTVELIVKNNRKIKTLEKEIHELKDSLETRKLIEKAKGILMKRDGLSEHEAFRMIQKQSMDNGVPVKEITKAIIFGQY